MRADTVTTIRVRVLIALAVAGALTLMLGLVLAGVGLEMHLGHKNQSSSLTGAGFALAGAGMVFGIVVLTIFAVGKAAGARRTRWAAPRGGRPHPQAAQYRGQGPPRTAPNGAGRSPWLAGTAGRQAPGTQRAGPHGTGPRQPQGRPAGGRNGRSRGEPELKPTSVYSPGGLLGPPRDVREPVNRYGAGMPAYGQGLRQEPGFGTGAQGMPGRVGRVPGRPDAVPGAVYPPEGDYPPEEYYEPTAGSQGPMAGGPGPMAGGPGPMAGGPGPMAGGPGRDGSGYYAPAGYQAAGYPGYQEAPGRQNVNGGEYAYVIRETDEFPSRGQRAEDRPAEPARVPEPEMPRPEAAAAPVPQVHQEPPEQSDGMFVYRDNGEPDEPEEPEPIPGYGPPDPDWYANGDDGSKADAVPSELEYSRGPFEPYRPSGGTGPNATSGMDLSEDLEPDTHAETGVQEDGDGPQAIDQIKDLYRTAEAIGDDNVDKHFDELLARQRELISDYFKGSGVAKPASFGNGAGGGAQDDAAEGSGEASLSGDKPGMP